MLIFVSVLYCWVFLIFPTRILGPLDRVPCSAIWGVEARASDRVSSQPPWQSPDFFERVVQWNLPDLPYQGFWSSSSCTIFPPYRDIDHGDRHVILCCSIVWNYTVHSSSTSCKALHRDWQSPSMQLVCTSLYVSGEGLSLPEDYLGFVIVGAGCGLSGVSLWMNKKLNCRARRKKAL
jgi:hypothetical protein